MGARHASPLPAKENPASCHRREAGQIWKVLLARMAILWYSLLRQSQNALRLGYEGIFYRPGPMQTEPANLVRRGTEQP